MAETTKIEWATATWNPWYGCSKISPACDNCYAERWAKRAGIDFKKVQRAQSQTFTAPLKWRQQRIFVCSLSDFFITKMWEPVTHGIIIACSPGHDAVNVMAENDSNIYMLLTKRPENILKCFQGTRFEKKIPENIWLGITVENQEQVKRAETLQDIDCRIKFISMEPLLTPVTFPDGLLKKFQWCIVGGESGGIHKVRGTAAAWVESILDQCRKAGVKFFFKQRGTAFLEENIECESIKEFPL